MPSISRQLRCIEVVFFPIPLICSFFVAGNSLAQQRPQPPRDGEFADIKKKWTTPNAGDDELLKLRKQRLAAAIEEHDSIKPRCDIVPDKTEWTEQLLASCRRTMAAALDRIEQPSEQFAVLTELLREADDLEIDFKKRLSQRSCRPQDLEQIRAFRLDLEIGRAGIKRNAKLVDRDRSNRQFQALAKAARDEYAAIRADANSYAERWIWIQQFMTFRMRELGANLEWQAAPAERLRLIDDVRRELKQLQKENEDRQKADQAGSKEPETVDSFIFDLGLLEAKIGRQDKPLSDELRKLLKERCDAAMATHKLVKDGIKKAPREQDCHDQMFQLRYGILPYALELAQSNAEATAAIQEALKESRELEQEFSDAAERGLALPQDAWRTRSYRLELEIRLMKMKRDIKANR